MQRVADAYFGGEIPAGVAGLLSPPHRLGALALLRDVAAAASPSTAGLSSAVLGELPPEPGRGSGFAAVLARLQGAETPQEPRFLLLLLVWVCPPFAAAIGADPELWTEYEAATCGRAVKHSTVTVAQSALHPIELYHRFVLLMSGRD